jgi:hypothetical protein
MSNVPIADHALLSDCHSAAMVTRVASIDGSAPRLTGRISMSLAFRLG